MAKLYFNYSTMNAGKSTVLLQAAHNYGERGMETYLLTADFDGRAGDGKIASRIGKIRAPVMLQWGTADPWFPPDRPDENRLTNLDKWRSALLPL